MNRRFQKGVCVCVCVSGGGVEGKGGVAEDRFGRCVCFRRERPKVER